MRIVTTIGAYRACQKIIDPDDPREYLRRIWIDFGDAPGQTCLMATNGIVLIADSVPLVLDDETVFNRELRGKAVGFLPGKLPPINTSLGPKENLSIEIREKDVYGRRDRRKNLVLPISTNMRPPKSWRDIIINKAASLPLSNTSDFSFRPQHLANVAAGLGVEDLIVTSRGEWLDKLWQVSAREFPTVQIVFKPLFAGSKK